MEHPVWNTDTFIGQRVYTVSQSTSPVFKCYPRALSRGIYTIINLVEYGLSDMDFFWFKVINDENRTVVIILRYVGTNFSRSNP